MMPLTKSFPEDIIDLSFLKEIKPESLTKDEGVIKYLVKPGKDILAPLQPPKKGATTKVKYEGRKIDGELLTKPELRRITLFTDNMIEGLHLAIASMKVGELAWYKFSPSYHYFNENLTNAIQQEIDIDKNQSLFYKIELIDYKNNENNTYEGRLEHYAYCRMKGNESFKENKYEEAFKQYEIGLNFLRNFPKKLKENMTELQNKEIEDYSLKLFTNAVICKVKLHKWYEGIKIIEEALKAHSSNINAAKIWYNKGYCHYNVNELDKAKDAFDKVLELEPNNQEALNMKSKFTKTKIDEKTREKITYKLILENMVEEEEKEKKIKKLKKKIEESNKLKEEGQNDDNLDDEELEPKISISDLEKGIIIDTNNPKTILEDEDELEEDILKN